MVSTHSALFALRKTFITGRFLVFALDGASDDVNVLVVVLEDGLYLLGLLLSFSELVVRSSLVLESVLANGEVGSVQLVLVSDGPCSFLGLAEVSALGLRYEGSSLVSKNQRSLRHSFGCSVWFASLEASVGVRLQRCYPVMCSQRVLGCISLKALLIRKLSLWSLLHV